MANDLADLGAEIDAALSDARLAEAGAHAERVTIVCALISEAFRRRGLRATVVGGGAIEFHLPNAYASDDADLVVEASPTRPTRAVLDEERIVSYRDWDLTRLRRMWATRRLAVERARQDIDTTGMTRPARHPFKSQWLRQHGDPGPFREVCKTGASRRESR